MWAYKCFPLLLAILKSKSPFVLHLSWFRLLSEYHEHFL